MLKLTSYLTPFKTAVVMIIMIYCEGNIDSDVKVEVMSKIVAFVDSDENDEVTEADGSLKMLQKILTPQILSLLQDKLSQIETLDDLFSFYGGIEVYMKPGEEELEVIVMQLAPGSILGSFLRRCVLAFNELNFDQISEFWKAFVAFREETSDLQQISSENLDHLMEHYASLFANQGIVLPKFLKDRLKQLGNSLPSTAYFVQYLDACYNRDYEKAFEYLHRFYDYSMDRKTRVHYQYALFTLAILQAEFDSTNEAMRAAQEAIAVARENKDMGCLTQIMSWLYSYMQSNNLEFSLASLDQISQFLQSKSMETSPHLYSLSCQAEAARILHKGESLTLVFELLLKSQHLNLHYKSVAESDLNLVKSTLWSQCGVMDLAKLYLDLEFDHGLGTELQLVGQRAWLDFLQGQFKLGTAKLDPCYEHVWLPRHLIICAYKALDTRVHDASSLLHILQKLNCDNEMRLEVKCLEISLDLRIGNYASAMSKCEKQTDVEIMAYQVRFMLLKVRCLLGTNSASRATSLVLRSFQLAHRSGHVPLALESLILLAKTLNSRKEFHEASVLLDTIMPALFETNRARLISEAFDALADSMDVDRHPERQARYALYKSKR